MPKAWFRPLWGLFVEPTAYNLCKWLTSLPAFTLMCGTYALITVWLCPTDLHAVLSKRKKIKGRFSLPSPSSLFSSVYFPGAHGCVPQFFLLFCTSPHVHSNSFKNLPAGIWRHLSVLLLMLWLSFVTVTQYLTEKFKNCLKKSELHERNWLC